MPIFYDGIPSPLGPLWFVSSDGLSSGERAGLAWIKWGIDETTLQQEITCQSGCHLNPTRDPGRLREWRYRISDYFSGRKIDFDGPIVPLVGTPFQQQVWRQMRTIPYGRVCSYAEVAQLLGSPGAARAVGAACGKNPIPIVVPCHRVIRQDGTLGGYSGGVHIKKVLLRIEGIEI